jgi:aryl-alcohol dehydrogenase-like predicted oxidoreductase
VEYVTLGRTGLEASVAGLGCGGHSRLGKRYGASDADAERVVRAALDLGINFIDTARGYGTEAAVGSAIRGRRDAVIVSTKSHVDPEAGVKGLRDNLEKSLEALRTDYVDIFHLHGLRPSQYDYCAAELVPAMKRFQQEGKVRFIGATELFGRDTGHEMLERAVPDGHFDVIMVGFNLLNHSARARVFRHTVAHDIGTLIMFAVRRALSRDDALKELIDDLLESGELDAANVNTSAPMEFVTRHPEVHSLVEAAYRFCRHEPGAHVILTGTGKVEHLEENVRAILAPQLPREIVDELSRRFGHLDCVSGN